MRVALASLSIGYVKALLLDAVVFIPFERLAPARRGQRVWRRGSTTDALTGLLNSCLVYGVLLIAIGGINRAATVSVPHLRAWVDTLPLWAQAAIALSVGDLGIYGVHRLAHEVPWLWRFHAVHHSAEEMDWLVAVRFHPVDLLCVRLASLGPLVALNVTPAALAIVVMVLGWQSWLAHANVRVPYGPLRWVLVSPEFHHWHHSADRKAHNRNYASLFACWDVMFGTVHLPSEREPSHYGAEEPVPTGWVDRFFHPFRGTAPESWRERAAEISQGQACHPSLRVPPLLP
jgi:sterol desaturase/sphingolipid hydroxylase (fatty acid hydroxylase superfamily)